MIIIQTFTIRWQDGKLFSKRQRQQNKQKTKMTATNKQTNKTKTTTTTTTKNGQRGRGLKNKQLNEWTSDVVIIIDLRERQREGED